MNNYSSTYSTACTRASLDGPAFDQTWLLEGVAGLPVLWVVETEGWQQ